MKLLSQGGVTVKCTFRDIVCIFGVDILLARMRAGCQVSLVARSQDETICCNGQIDREGRGVVVLDCLASKLQSDD